MDPIVSKHIINDGEEMEQESQPAAMPSLVVNVGDVNEVEHIGGDHWGSARKALTPALDARPGRLGANLLRIPPGRTAFPFHTHAREDEVFFVLSGRGVFRYGDTVQEIRAGDCISCPAGTGVGHQLANPFDEDLVYLAVGMNDPHEVCTYPDSGKVMVRSLKTVGRLAEAPYMDGELARPKVLDLAQSLLAAANPSGAASES
ncbi:cupin domain-containing protein [Burkholderia sp. Z1]|uniref:cupin domain-containing protein n=1 Tax=Burkholderia sp. Z1 TaxID=2759039 RepID=UPI001868AC27|nr:cupin domain-containing protein [Burkholderia sp. Z1]